VIPPRRRIGWALRRRCPRCGGPGIFSSYFRLRDRCPRCGYQFERESGFFTGVYLINYSITGALLFVLIMTYTLVAASRATSPPLAPFIAGGIFIAVALPIAGYPFAKALWAAIDLLMRPLDPVEEATAALHADPDEA
jgi:uncharacterized protein (DUF983 family)